MAASRIGSVRPFIRLSPAHSRDNSRSTSPERHPGSLYQKIDPLLSNLSPESTLHALTSTEAVPSNENFSHDVLSRSISQVSPAERALGIRAAIAAQNLNLWYKEVQSWTWPKQNDAKAGKGFLPPVESRSGHNAPESRSVLPPSGGDVDYYGSLPVDVVEEYEKRIEEIRDGMDNLDVEELKAHVLNAHIPSRSRPSSSTSTVSVPPPLSYVQLSDFTAVVTATILRALPFLSRLSSLLITWDVRLLVLRQIPGLLRELKATRSAIDSSFHALRTSTSSDDSQTLFSDSYIRAEHVKLESAVVAVGRRMDRVLDALEGRQDSLPESWIDDLENIESDFAAWVVEAERYKLRTGWLRSKEEAKTSETIETSEPQPEQSTEETQQGAASAAESGPKTLTERPQMETIEEEPKPDSSVSALCNAEEAERNVQVSAVHSTSIDSGFPANFDPSTASPAPNYQVPCVSEKKETEPTSENQSNVLVAEDVRTPTQLNFFMDRAVEPREQLSPTRVPLPATPDVENKENIPPHSAIQQPVLSSPRDSAAKPVALTERDVGEDPFIQKPSSPSSVEAKEVPEIAVSVDEPSEDEPPIAKMQDETVEVKPEEHIQDAKLPGETVQADTVTPTHNTVDFISGEPQSGGPSAAPDAPTTPSIEIASAEDPMESIEIPDPDYKPSAKSASQQAERSSPISTESQHANFEALPAHLPSSDLPGSSRKPLQSPIKLSKSRPGKLNLDKDAKTPRPRRPSTGSVGSLLSDNSSLLSSPDEPEPHTGSSNDQMTPSRPDIAQPHSIQQHGDYMLREDRLLRLENPRMSSRTTFPQNRSVSLPLQRFINEELAFGLEDGSAPDMAGLESATKDSVAAKSPDHGSSTPTPQVPRVTSRRPALIRGKSVSDLKSSDQRPRNLDRNFKPFGQNTAHRAMHHQDQPKSLRLRKRLTAHPSLESLGVKRQELAYVEEDESEMTDIGSRASSPNKQSRKPRDHLDEKITSILSTLPGRIHLVDPNNEADTSSSSSSLDRKMRDRYLSESPHGPSRSITPAPSLTLMPAARRRLSHAHKAEDSCVKLYHLHHGGQTVPTKLFVRTVGEDGQRVMVRVGGGWADLGEYLREYVIHHGRRKVSETPRVEVQGLAPRLSPGYSPGAIHTPAPSSYLTSGRATPSRPPSVLSTRPPSSLTVRKVRRGSNASEASGMVPRSVTTGTLNYITSPPTAPTSRRRLSLSSNYSIGDAHSPANAALGPAHDSHSTPLGLAGPKPRSRQVSMSPEGEAWVEDVLQQTRRSSSLNPPPFALNVAPETDAAERHDVDDHDQGTNSLPKVRSVSDIGSISTSRRVVLRGLGNRR